MRAKAYGLLIESGAEIELTGRDTKDVEWLISEGYAKLVGLRVVVTAKGKAWKKREFNEIKRQREADDAREMRKYLV